jgi:hypothetical protein
MTFFFKMCSVKDKIEFYAYRRIRTFSKTIYDSLFLIKIIIRNLIYILEKDKEIDKEDFKTA